MGIFREARQDIGGLRIAMPDEMITANRLVYKWPEKSIRKFTKAFVPEGYSAVFVNSGQVIGQLGPGQYTIDAQELPVIGVLIDRLFYDNAYRCELIFLRTAETRGLRFGGPFDTIKEPDFKMPVSIRVYGDYSLRVFDGGLLIKTVIGTADQPDNEIITSFIGRQILNAMGELVSEGILDHTIPVLGIKSQASEITEATMAKLNPVLAENGMQLVRFGDFTINLKEEDEARLKDLSDKVASKRAMIGLASDPNYLQYAQGQVLEGAGEGLAEGGAANQTAFLGMGLGLGGAVNAPFQQGMAGQGLGQPASPPPATAPCPSCGEQNREGSKFCHGCGTSLGPPTVACPSCGAANDPNAKFCGDCGTKMKASCRSCNADLLPTAKFCPECGTSTAPPASPASGEEPAADGGG
ncbi:MAG: hypothetical protein AVDCRST_MAG76-3222 [uncultured Acidimicrobiales bacterium]|uniref:Virion core protein (Lumpy skin disease virus) n=1 Tax=uncultured Acidimicrobiales bacterium TaxID=310071 RepID=A0A6J4J6R0_9ACTN|nr:MAG: hypothetical protein AVDCRST_MAG76-3222 [uncultured Acidimicrobiales bacterium]